jgi:hypothetical protein
MHELETAEAALGCGLPELLRRLYLEVANGGFGPGYGLLGVPPLGAKDDLQHDLVSLYALYREADPDDPHWVWPEGLLPLVHLGCAMYGCLNVRAAGAPIIWFEPNPHEPGTPWDGSFIPLIGSLAGWLEAWLEGRDLIMEYAARVERGEDERSAR